MLDKRMSLSYSEEMDKFLAKRAKETGATKGGVIRNIVMKEARRDADASKA